MTKPLLHFEEAWNTFHREVLSNSPDADYMKHAFYAGAIAMSYAKANQREQWGKELCEYLMDLAKQQGITHSVEH